MEAWKALWNPEYRGRLGQRLGYVECGPPGGCLWVHAVSVGEVQAAAALIRKLHQQFPAVPVVITTVTPTGAQRARALFGDSVRHCYLPYDLPGSVRRFLDRLRPHVAIILETEIWPTLYDSLGKRGIPLVLASARLSTRSVDRYRRMASLFRETLSHGILIGAQTAADAERFRAIGAAAGRVHVTGNVKFDLEIAADSIAAGRDFRALLGGGATVVDRRQHARRRGGRRCSRRTPSCAIGIPARYCCWYRGIRSASTRCATLLRRQGIAYAQRSSGEAPAPDHSVFLVDTLGELQTFYAAADVAFVGGSLVPVGGHSLLEPAVLALPMLSGPHVQNAQDVADLLEQCGALRIVRSREELADRVCQWLDDPALARTAGERGRQAVAQSRGAVQRLVAMVAPLLTSAAPAVEPPAAAPGSSGSR